MCNAWRLIELTNGNIGPVAVDALVPLGSVTRKVAREPRCTPTFSVDTTANNVVTIDEHGIYNVEYTGTLVAAAAGTLTLNLLQNNTAVATRSITVAVGDSVNVALSKEIRVYRNCCCQQNMPIQLALSITGVAITGGNGTLIVNRQAAV